MKFGFTQDLNLFVHEVKLFESYKNYKQKVWTF